MIYFILSVLAGLAAVWPQPQAPPQRMPDFRIQPIAGPTNVRPYIPPTEPPK
jgi:hypothetical protein